MPQQHLKIVETSVSYKTQRMTRLTFGMLCFLAGVITTVLLGVLVFILDKEQ